MLSLFLYLSLSLSLSLCLSLSLSLSISLSLSFSSLVAHRYYATMSESYGIPDGLHIFSTLAHAPTVQLHLTLYYYTIL